MNKRRRLTCNARCSPGSNTHIDIRKYQIEENLKKATNTNESKFELPCLHKALSDWPSNGRLSKKMTRKN